AVPPVLLGGGKTEVVHVHARPVPAEVIDVHPLRDRAIDALPCVAVGTQVRPARIERSVSALGLPARPEEAVAGPFGVRPERVFGRVVPSRGCCRHAGAPPVLIVPVAESASEVSLLAPFDGACGTLFHAGSTPT